MSHTSTINDVPADQVTQVMQDFKDEGVSIVIQNPQPDGKFTVVATFDDAAASPALDAIAAPVVVAPAAGIPARLPDYAQNVLSAAQGVPWAQAGAMPQYNGYLGIVQDSFHVFHNLTGMPEGVTSAAYYECKLSSDSDGSVAPKDANPPFHDSSYQNDTSLHETTGPLNAFLDAYAVLPLDQSETTVNKHGLPDFGNDLGLQLGDIGVAFWRESNSGDPNHCYFIYGDKGPPVKLGEGSVNMAVQLGIPDANIGNGHELKEIISMGKGIIHIGFIGSGAALLAPAVPGNRPQTTIDAAGVIVLGQKLFSAFTNQPASS